MSRCGLIEPRSTGLCLLISDIFWVKQQPEIKRESRKQKKKQSLQGRKYSSVLFSIWSTGWVGSCRIFYGIYEILEIFNSLLVIRACNNPLEDNFHIFPESISENMEIYWAQPQVILSAALSKYHLRLVRGTGLFVQRGNIQIHINDNGFVHAFSVVVMPDSAHLSVAL